MTQKPLSTCQRIKQANYKPGIPLLGLLAVSACSSGAPLAQQRLVQTNLVSNSGTAGAVTTDPNLVNSWGLVFSPAGPLWVADNGTGLATVYSSVGAIQPLVVTIPPPAGGTSPSAPTGEVFNPTGNFLGDKFIFATEDGTISGWQAGTNAVLRIDQSAGHSVFKGLAITTLPNTTRLFATDFHNGVVATYDGGYMPIVTEGRFIDPNLPAGFAPFGIQAVGTTVIVTYALQDEDAHDDVAGVGNGFVDLFTVDGQFQQRLVSNGRLNSPWGIAIAPSDFGALSSAVLIGNFGDGLINAYHPTSGVQLAIAADPSGNTLAIDGLWSLVFGNDTAGAAHNQLFFTAGPNGETGGLLGRLDLAP
jgi:uncharacterized protein (TIGR03118 family)